MIKVVAMMHNSKPKIEVRLGFERRPLEAIPQVLVRLDLMVNRATKQCRLYNHLELRKSEGHLHFCEPHDRAVTITRPPALVYCNMRVRLPFAGEFPSSRPQHKHST